MKIHKSDIVRLISGNDKGKQGKVLAVFPDIGKIVVEGVNIKKKHVRPRSQGKKGELVRIPAPFPASRVMLACGKCGVTRTGYKKSDTNQKVRVCKKCDAEV